MNPNLFALFSDTMIRRVFIELAKRKKVSVREFQQVVPDLSPEQLAEDLERLRQERLVEVVSSAAHHDFDTYYLTEDGLKSYRALTTIAVGM